MSSKSSKQPQAQTLKKETSSGRNPHERYMLALDEWKRGRRRASSPFNGLAIFFLFIFIFAYIDVQLLEMFRSPIDLLFGLSSSEISGTDSTQLLFTSEFSSDEDRVFADKDIAYQIEAEGATLIKNEHDILPLTSGMQVSLIFSPSVNMILDPYQENDEPETTRSLFEEALITSGFELVSSDDAYSGCAVVVISRQSSENSDLSFESGEGEPQGGYLALTQDEQNLLLELAALKEAKNIDGIVLLINSSNAFQLDFLDDEAYGIDAVLHIGVPGTSGLQAVADILAGIVNPSGRLSDSLLTDNSSAPSTANLTAQAFEGELGQSLSAYAKKYLVYTEGIYVGYRYFETRYTDYVTERAHTGDYMYASCVSRPFGYGLSYTDFAYSDFEVSYLASSDVFEVSLTVSNIGNAAGKHTVLVFGQSPYTAYDEANGVEKAAVELVGFEKTSELMPGESEELLITVEKADFAAYDASNAKTYILDAGEYYLAVAADAHIAANSILAAQGYTPENTSGRMDANGSLECVYTWTEDTLDATTYAVSASGAAITNLFDSADINTSEYTENQNVVYLSRSDWEGTYPHESATFELTESLVSELANCRYDQNSYDGIYADGTTSVSASAKASTFYDLICADDRDSAAEALLDPLSVADMAELLGGSYYGTSALASVSLPASSARGNSFGLTAALFERNFDTEVAELPSEEIVGATYNRELVARVGEILGEDALASGVSCLYAPGAGIHRSAYGGKNAEAYSEDPYLSSQLLAVESAGIESKGCHVLVSGFALDTQNTDRLGLGIWCSEQAIREIYLEPYRLAIQTGIARGVMSSYNRIGAHYVGADENLISGLLRGEWGFEGIVSSSDSGIFYSYMNGVDSVLAGSDIFCAMVGLEKNQLLEYADDPAVVLAMRTSAKRVLLFLASSSAANGVGADTEVRVQTYPFYIIIAWIFFGLTFLAFLGFTIVYTSKSVAYKRDNPRPTMLDFV